MTQVELTAANGARVVVSWKGDLLTTEFYFPGNPTPAVLRTRGTESNGVINWMRQQQD